MRKDISSLNDLQLSFEEQSIALRFEQRPSLVDWSYGPPLRRPADGVVIGSPGGNC
jgi:hypothetical protein